MSGGAASPKPTRPAFCPKCNGQMDLRDAKCPHCGYDFPTTQPGADLLSVWAWFALIAVCVVAIVFDFDQWLEIAVIVLCLGFALLRTAWRRWDRYWNMRHWKTR